MEQHAIDVDEREHRQEEQECIQIADQNEMNSDEPPCIFKVHEGLRHVNEKAYTPMLVSIGPYHHGRSELSDMEIHKERYLKLFLQNNNQSEEPYLNCMKRLEERARNYYANPVDHLDSDKFVKMMLKDACFVTKFLRGIEGLVVDDDPIFNVAWMTTQICSDLMLLENQLPFFVISEFFDMTQNPNQNHPINLTLILAKLATGPIIEMLPGEIDISKIDYENTSISGSKHFLDLVHNVCLPSSKLIDESNDCHDKNQKTCFKMACVIELKDAGVKFDAEEEGDDELSRSMFDKRFEHGHFKIPKFQVTDSTETFFRNIIAYEQHSSDNELKYFTDYTHFMDLLINSKEDVKQLRHDEVLENWLGDDEEVALMFNKLGQGTITLNKFYYSELCNKVNAHCKRWCNRVLATLKRDYFKNIWVTVATFAAAFLLLLTLGQTIISLITIVDLFQSRSRS